MGHLARFIRVALVLGATLTSLVLVPPQGPRGVMPRRVREAGRDEGLYRRLKWREAQRGVQARAGRLKAARQNQDPRVTVS